MSAITELEREFLTRKEAAEYLSTRWMKMSVPTLNKHAVAGDGPRYTNRGAHGGEAMYRRCDLDAWARGFIDKPLGKRRVSRLPPKRRHNPTLARGALTALGIAHK